MKISKKFTSDNIVDALIFLFFLAYLEILKGIKVHYALLPLILIYAFTKFGRLRIDLPVLFFFLILEFQSMVAYILYEILFYDNALEKIFINQIMLIGNIFLYFIVASFYSLDKLMKILAVSGVIYGFFIVYEIYSNILKPSIVYRWTGTFEDPNYFALLLILFISSFLYFVLNTRHISYRIIFLFFSAIYIYSLIFTFSRSGFLSLVIFFFTFAIVSRRWKESLIALMFTTLPIVLYFYINQEMLARVLSFLEYRLFSDAEVQSGLSRIKEIEAGLSFMASHFPVSLLGMGYASSEITAFFENYYATDAVIKPRIHNTYISILSENGILGCLIFLYILFRNYKYVMSLEDKDKKGLLLALYFSSLVSSMFVWNLYFLPFYIITLWIPKLAKS